MLDEIVTARDTHRTPPIDAFNLVQPHSMPENEVSIDGPPPLSSSLPIVLLKPKTDQEDAYEKHFRTQHSRLPDAPSVLCNLTFLPVLDHQLYDEPLRTTGDLLKHGMLKASYGGMIFTSQRACKAWAHTVARIEDEMRSRGADSKVELDSEDRLTTGNSAGSSFQFGRDQTSNVALDVRTKASFVTDIEHATPFPLYVVGPNTRRTLEDEVLCHHLVSNLNPQISGTHTGNAANLADHIIQHYNTLHGQRWFTYHDAPRLPFIPLLGMGSENYSRRRLESDDRRLQKKPLLFLVGEKRRDYIPRALMDEQVLGSSSRIQVEEIEVYKTNVKENFREDFENVLAHVKRQNHEEKANRYDRRRLGNEFHPRTEHNTKAQHHDILVADTTNTPRTSSIVLGSYGLPALIAIVLFSPQGSDIVLKALGFLDEATNTVTALGRSNRWDEICGRHTTITTTAQSATDDSESVEIENKAAGQSQLHSNGSDDRPPSPSSVPYYIIVAIGPTTRDHLRDKFGFEVDVCAKTPSPQGVEEGVTQFLMDLMNEKEQRDGVVAAASWARHRDLDQLQRQ